MMARTIENAVHLTAARLREAVSYNPADGSFAWCERPAESFADRRRMAQFNNTRVGRPAFTSVSRRGYYVGRFEGRIYTAHRVAWLVHTGAWPEGQIDHINGNKLDNRIANLRECSAAQNAWNVGRRSSHHYKNIRPVGERWQAYIFQDGRQVYLGTYATPEEAARAYDAAALRLRGEFARVNFPTSDGA